MVACSVGGDEQRAVHAPEAVQHPPPAEGIENGIIDGEEFPGFDGVEQVPDLVGGGDLADVEKRLGIATPLPLLHGLLDGKEGRALHEEHREGGLPGILYRRLRVTARSCVGEQRHRAADQINCFF